MPHGEGWPVPDTRMKNTNAGSSWEESESEIYTNYGRVNSRITWKITSSCTTEGFNDLVWDLKLSKQRSDLLDSRLEQWNLLAEGILIYRKIHTSLGLFF